MTGERQAGLCPDDAIAGLVGIAADDDQAGIDEADRLMRDRLAAAADRLEAGIARNTEHPILNRDMGLLIDEARAALRAAEGDAPMSSTQQLLQSFSSRQTRH